MILALDLGSTSFKAAVFDERLREVSFGSHPLRHRFGAGQQVEIDAAAVHAALRGALREARVREHDLRIIALTSQAQTLTLVDAGGTARIPFISWQDRRAVQAAAELERLLGRDFPQHTSFGKPGPGLFLSKVRMLRPDAGLMPLNLPSYVLRLWTGASVTDANIAAMSGLYSLPLGGWWPEAVRACRLRAEQLPELISVGGIAAGTTATARAYGLPCGIPVVLAGNDQTAGGYAARLDRRKALLITLGTAQVAYACCERMPPPQEGIIRGPYPGGLFYRMTADSGGTIVNWAKRFLAGCGDDPGFFRTAARSPQGARGLVFEAELDRECGAWRNLGLHHDASDLARSILETLSRRMASMVSRLEVDLTSCRILAAGGGSVRPLWRRLIAEALGAPLVRVDGRPLLGAARMAAQHRPTPASARPPVSRTPSES